MIRIADTTVTEHVNMSYLPTGRQLWGTEMYKNKSLGGGGGGDGGE